MPIRTLHVETGAMRRFRQLSLLITAGAWLVIVLGGLIRATNNAAWTRLSWPSVTAAARWPQIAHLGAGIVLAGGTLLLWRLAYAQRAYLRSLSLRLAQWGFVALLLQIATGFWAAAAPGPSPLDWAHGTLSAVSLALLAAIGLTAWPSARNRGVQLAQIVRAQDEFSGFGFWLTLAAAAAFAMTLTGVAAAQSQAAGACPAFPHCGASAAPSSLRFLAMLHRGLELTALVSFLWLSWRFIGLMGRSSIGLRRWNRVMLLLFAAQVGLGLGVSFLESRPVWLDAVHLGLAAAIWASLAALLTIFRDGMTAVVTSGEQITPAPLEQSQRRLAARFFDFFWLTKPYITVLLLITTLAAMLVATAGQPPWGLALWTLLGGALSASSANTINAYIEREKDKIMPRTQRRPLAKERIVPRQALIYGVALGILSVAVFLAFVNPLSALLSTLALFYYVVIYTLWLKPRTPYNIVIGGAAGAFPPLIGWTAVTGQIEPLALLLFAVVFTWTPPHTWALTLLAQRDYALVNIPMWPVIFGEQATRKQIVVYTWPMLIVTLLPAALRMLGPVYLAAALALGGVFIYLALRLQQTGAKTSALSLYKYSTLYLALLFAAMVVDRVV